MFQWLGVFEIRESAGRVRRNVSAESCMISRESAQGAEFPEALSETGCSPFSPDWRSYQTGPAAPTWTTEKRKAAEQQN